MRKGKINSFLCSIYHPMEQDEQKQFNEELASFYKSISKRSELLSGQDINASVGITSRMF